MFQDVLSYSIVGDANDFSYFYINPESGLISLKRTLTEAVGNQFDVNNFHNSCLLSVFG